MKTITDKAPVVCYEGADYERAVVNSALWAAAGDALGWMTELSRGTSGVQHRTGTKEVTKPVAWQRVIGGRSGVKVDLPAGTYSDDTQLRLCVSRAIRGNGVFDVESFAKIEITSWQGYCLGAGIGSKAAAANLAKRGVNWFSNFFSTERQKYVTAGGNGAAMRIQPHVWSATGTLDEMTLRVMRDAVVTHGHPHGFCGAVFHALCLWEALTTKRIPDLESARQFVRYMDRLPGILEHDNELASFWKPAWERETGTKFADGVRRFNEEALSDISLLQDIFQHSGSTDYHSILSRLGCLTDKFRGSGFKTALAALALSLIYQPERIEDALVRSANELESDTDTIATMAGALLGALAFREPDWSVQDNQYLKEQALRMAKIAQKQDALSFSYPDVSLWEPPTNQSDAIGFWKDDLALVGIGKLERQSQEYSSGSSIWQWFQLPFGQSILAKRRRQIKSSVDDHQMPGNPVVSKQKRDNASVVSKQNSFAFEDQKNPAHAKGDFAESDKSQRFPGIDKATDAIIASNFDNAKIGHFINLCIEETESIDAVVGLSAIIAKARLARMRRK